MQIIQGAKAGQKKAHTPVIADDSVASISKIKVLYGLSEGEVKGLVNGAASIMLDGTPLIDGDGQTNFEGVTWEVRNGTVDQSHIAGMPSISNETGVGVPLRSGTPWVRAITDTQLSSVNINVSWPRLSEQKENGDVVAVSVSYSIDVQTDGMGWATLLNASVNDKTSSRYQRTHNVPLPPAQTGWQIRVRKNTADGDGERVFNAMQIDSIAEIIDAKLRYPNTALLYLSFDARAFSRMPKLSVDLLGRYIKVPSNYDAEAKQSSGIWNGTFKTAYSDNPAWIYYDIITNDRYGLGDRLKPFMVDKWAIAHIASICDASVSNGRGGVEPRFRCNLYLQKSEDAFQVLQHVAAIFRGMAYWDGSQIVLDADQPRDCEYVITRANVIDGEFIKTGSAASDRHTIAKVAFSDPNNAYETDFVMVRNERAIMQQGINVLEVASVGCTSESQAYRAGRAALLSEQYRTQSVSFKMGLDGRLPSVGKRIDIADAMFTGVNNGGRISSVNTSRNVITVDRDNIAAKAGDKLVVNLESGKAQTRTIVSVNGRDVTVSSAFEKVGAQNVWAVSSDDLPTMPFIVMSVVGNDDGTEYDVNALQYDVAIYPLIDSDVRVTLPTPPPSTSIDPSNINAPTSVSLASRSQINQGITQITLQISWAQVKNAVTYEVEYSYEGGSWLTVGNVSNVSTDLTNVKQGNYKARVRAVSAFGVRSKYTESTSFNAIAKAPIVGQQLTFNAIGILFGMYLSWQFGNNTADTDYVEIQSSANHNTDAPIVAVGKVAYPTTSLTISNLGVDVWQSYRARIVDKLGNKSDWTAWVEAVTSSDAEAVLDILTDQISKTQLAQDMKQKVELIDVNKAAISQETQDRIDAVLNSNNSIAAERDARTNAIQQSATEQQQQLQATADALANDINTVTVAQSATDGQLATVKERQQTLINENGVQAEQLNYLSSEMSFGYTDATKYTDKSRATVWSFAKTIAHADYVNAESIRALSADYQNSSASFNERISLNVTANQAVAQQVSTLSAQMVGGYTGNDVTQITSGLLHQERQATATRFEGLAQQISLISAGVGEQFDPYQIWHFDSSSDGWTAGTYATGWLNIRTETISSPVFELNGNGYRQIKLRVQKHKSPAWGGLVSWSGGSMAIAEPTFDTNNIATIDIDVPWSGTITGFSLKLASAADNLNYYAIDWIAVGRPSPGASNAALLREEQTRANQFMALTQANTALDSKLNTQVSQLSSAITNNMQTLTTEQQSQAERITSLDSKFSSDIGNMSSNITDINNTLTDAVGAQAERINTIVSDYKPSYTDASRYTDVSRSTQWTYAKTVARDSYALSEKTDLIQSTVNQNDAKYTREITTLATTTEVIARDVEQISVETASNLALINSESVTRADQFGSLSTQVTQISAKAQSALDKGLANTGLIQQESTARADQYGSIVQQTQTLQTIAQDADDRSKTNKTSIQQHTQSIDGLMGQWMLKIDVNNRISGIGLAAYSNISAFNIRADQFYISNPDDPNYKDVGFVYNSGTRADPETGTVIPKGLYLKAAFIKEASIDTLKIRGQAVTVTSSATANTPDGVAPTVYLNSGGGSVLLRVTFFGIKGRDNNHTVRLYKNGVQITSYSGEGSSSYFGMSDSFEVVTSGSFGTDRFHAVWEGLLYVRSATVTAVSLKR